MPGREPREEDSVLSQLQLHRVAELHRVVEQRRAAANSIQDRERDRERPLVYHTALRPWASAVPRYVPPSSTAGALFAVDDEPADPQLDPRAEDTTATQIWELGPQVAALAAQTKSTGWLSALNASGTSLQSRCLFTI